MVAREPNSLPSSPPEAWEPLLRLARVAGRPLERFLRIEAASGIVLLCAAAVALAWANSPWAASYEAIFHTPVGIRVGEFTFERSLHWLVNDGLMVIFFFVVGMEIRREIHHGELSEWRRAALPVAAALGGMLVPALLFLSVADHPATRSGWGVPMATDIAFAVGVLTLLGNRVPAALRVLLLALAVIDDLGAIVVIAIFYSSGVTLSGFVTAGLGIAGVYVLRLFAVRNKLVYVAPAIIVWAGTSAAGIHPTIAGVVVGLLTPVRAWLGRDGFVQGVREELSRITERDARLDTPALGVALRQVDIARREALSPAEDLIDRLHPWVAFLVMPVFALANAGVSLGSVSFEPPSSSVALGVLAGLVLGKPLGIVIVSVLTLKLGIATLPRGLGFRHLTVLGVVAGIGFTMSLFIAELAFADAGLLGAAKLGVLVASILAGVTGLGLGAWLLQRREHVPAGVARTADEAERLTEA